MNNQDEKKLIVSITSYPARIHYVHKVLSTIFAQTMKPDEIVLYLAQEQFPGKESDLPEVLSEMIRSGKVKLRWVDDLKPHKKYFYAFQEYPDDLVITIDDDVLYAPDMIETLYHSYLRHPNAVSAFRTHLMMFSERYGIFPYEKWILKYNRIVDCPSQQLFCTGNAGVLYPVQLFNQALLNKEAILDHCIYADDIWLKLMEIVCDIPVVLADHQHNLQIIEGSQSTKLADINISEHMNDKQLEDSINWFDSKYGKRYVFEKLLDAQHNNDLRDIDDIAHYYTNKIDSYTDIIAGLQKRYDNIKNSRSYRIGRFITRPLRKIKSLIQ